MLHGSAYDAGGEFRPHGQLVTIETVGETEHLLLDNIGHFANTALEKGRLLENRHAHVAIAVGIEPAVQVSLQGLPEGAIRGQNIVHALDAGHFHAGGLPFFLHYQSLRPHAQACRTSCLHIRQRWPGTQWRYSRP